jgi:hypothetical protein
MVLRRERARRVLLWTGDDHAPGAGWAVESCDVLPWRSNHGSVEGLEQSIFHPVLHNSSGSQSVYVFYSIHTFQLTIVNSRRYKKFIVVLT